MEDLQNRRDTLKSLAAPYQTNMKSLAKEEYGSPKMFSITDEFSMYSKQKEHHLATTGQDYRKSKTFTTHPPLGRGLFDDLFLCKDDLNKIRN